MTGESSSSASPFSRKMRCVSSMIPLAITSTKGWIKRMGGRNWNKLHKAVYVAGAAACLHFFMMRKGLQYEPLVYGAIFAGLMLVRAVESLKRLRIAS